MMVMPYIRQNSLWNGRLIGRFFHEKSVFSGESSRAVEKEKSVSKIVARPDDNRGKRCQKIDE
jgi:hypothetical protein